MRISRTLTVGASCAVGLALALGASPALADPGAQPGDVVGVGSDTLQNLGDFIADGDITGDAGYNAAGNVNRMINFSATADANDRAVYGTGGAAIVPTVILRAGTSPVKRPNGSGSGLTALGNDTAGTTVNYSRSSSLSAIVSKAASVTGGLHAIKVATDDLTMAAAATSNAIAVDGATLVHIYKCDAGYTDWHSLNASAPVGSTIVPQYPQSGSGTRSTFDADLKTLNGGTAVTYGACTEVVEENDPASITGETVKGLPANAIAPMSSGRKDLFDSGYFKQPGDFPGGATITSSGLQLLNGSQPLGSCAAPVNAQAVPYCNTRGLYIAWRQNDSTSTTNWQPGSTRNWVKTLFWTGTSTKPFVQTSGGQALIAAAGVTPTYVDCGISTGGAFPGC